MSDSTSHTGPAQVPGGSPNPDRFFAWLRRLGIVRSDDRWFAGVAGGIAARAGIDPLIVRGVFVVLALLGGPGILLYLAGWLMLPDTHGRLHLEDIVRGRAPTGLIVAAALLGVFVALPILFSVVTGIFGGWWFTDAWGIIAPPEWLRVTLAVLWYAVVLPALIIGGIIWWAQVRGRGPSPSRTPGAPGTPGAADAAGAEQTTEPNRPEPAPASGTTPPNAGSPVNDAHVWGERQEQWRAQFADQTRRIREESRAWSEFGRHARVGAGHVVITLALALLAAGGSAAWALTVGSSTDVILTAALIATVAVFAFSVIVAGIRGRHSGAVGFLTFVGVIALIAAPFTHVLPENVRFVPIGSTNERMTETDALRSGVVTLIGSTELDLTALDGRAGDREIEVWQLLGSSAIELPSGVDAEVTSSVFGGTIHDEGVGSERRGMFLTQTVDSEPRAAGDGAVTVKVRVLFGSVRISGGEEREIADGMPVGADEQENAR